MRRSQHGRLAQSRMASHLSETAVRFLSPPGKGLPARALGPDLVENRLSLPTSGPRILLQLSREWGLGILLCEARPDVVGSPQCAPARSKARLVARRLLYFLNPVSMYYGSHRGSVRTVDKATAHQSLCVILFSAGFMDRGRLHAGDRLCQIKIFGIPPACVGRLREIWNRSQPTFGEML